MKIQSAGFLDNSTVNGEGLRSVVFFSGCSHKCKGCHNKAMQDYFYGDAIEINEVMDRIKHNLPLIDGVTISGGDPFSQPEGLYQMLKILNQSGINVWVYTGFEYEVVKLRYLEILKYIDVLIDGTFDSNRHEKNSHLLYRGSDNQRIINVQESLKNGSVMLYDVKDV